MIFNLFYLIKNSRHLITDIIRTNENLSEMSIRKIGRVNVESDGNLVNYAEVWNKI